MEMSVRIGRGWNGRAGSPRRAVTAVLGAGWTLGGFLALNGVRARIHGLYGDFLTIIGCREFGFTVHDVVDCFLGSLCCGQDDASVCPDGLTLVLDVTGVRL